VLSCSEMCLPAPLQEASCSLNFDTHTGRGKVSLANPRYSGLQGDSLSGGFRWEHDVVRLEKLVVQQQRSRCDRGTAAWPKALQLRACIMLIQPFPPPPPLAPLVQI
jgi:hypothetical protein